MISGILFILLAWLTNVPLWVAVLLTIWGSLIFVFNLISLIQNITKIKKRR